MAPALAVRERSLLESLFELTGIPDGDEACAALFDRRQSLAAVLSSEPQFISAVAGARAAESCHLVHRMMACALEADLRDRPLFNNQAAVVNYLRARCGHSTVEQAWVLFLDTKNHLLHQMMFPGTVDSAPLDARVIMTRGLEVGASGLILAHNHPAGPPEPSDSDRTATRRLAEAGRYLGIAVLDHLIITRAEHFSFRATNLL